MARDLKIKVGMDTVDFSRKAKDIQNFSSSIGSQLGSMFGVGLGVTAATTGLIRLTSKTIDYADEISDVSARLGISGEALQKWRFAATQTSAEMSNVETALSRMARAINNADNPLSRERKNIEDMGVNFAKLRELSLEEQFISLAKALRNVGNETTRVALAQELFGLGGKRILPMIMELDELSEAAVKSGVIISESAIQAASDFNDAWDRAIKGTQRALTESGIIEKLSDAMEQIADMTAGGEKGSSAWSAFAESAATTTLKYGGFGTGLATKAYELITGESFDVGNIRTKMQQTFADSVPESMRRSVEENSKFYAAPPTQAEIDAANERRKKLLNTTPIVDDKDVKFKLFLDTMKGVEKNTGSSARRLNSITGDR